MSSPRWSVENSDDSVQEPTWVKQNYGPETAQLRFIHFHLSHLCDQFSEDPIEDCAYAGLVGAAPVHVETSGQ